MKLSTFEAPERGDTPITHRHLIYQNRPGWLVGNLALHEIDREKYFGLGFLADVNALHEHPERWITWGVFTERELAHLRTELGSELALGKFVRGLTCGQELKSVSLPEELNLRPTTLPAFWNNCSPLEDQIARQQRVAEAAANEFLAREAAAKKLHRSWDASAMVHRADLPSWVAAIPAAMRVITESRQFLLLPPAPASPLPLPPPRPARAAAAR